MRVPSVPCSFAMAALLGLAFASAGSAQDAMQLDTAFRDSLLSKPVSEGHQGERGRDVSKARSIRPRFSRIQQSRVR